MILQRKGFDKWKSYSLGSSSLLLPTYEEYLADDSEDYSSLVYKIVKSNNKDLQEDMAYELPGNEKIFFHILARSGMIVLREKRDTSVYIRRIRNLSHP